MLSRPGLSLMAEVKGAVILAGGASRRMGGGDKCLKPLGGRPLLAWVLDKVRPQAARILINAGGDPSRFASFGSEVRADCLGGRLGPLAGILTGIKWLAERERSGCLLSVPCDAPFLPTNLAAKMAGDLDEDADKNNGKGGDIAIARSGGRNHPVCGLWNLDIAAELEMALTGGVRKIEDFTAPRSPTISEFASIACDPFLNLNHPKEFALAERLLRA